MPDYVGAVDQGTTSTRFMIFDHGGNEVARHQLEHEQILPQAGWVEHNPVEIWERTSSVIQSAMSKARSSPPRTSPRWASPTSARPRWSGTRRRVAPGTTRSSGRTPAPTGSPPSSSATATATPSGARPGCRRRRTSPGGKIKWILENVDGVREAAEKGEAIFGTTDSWLIWNLTGGTDGGVARHRRHQRQPHHADGPRDLRVGRRAARDLRHPARDAARHPLVLASPRATGRPWPTARCAGRCP